MDLLTSKKIDITKGFEEALKIMEYTYEHIFVTGRAGTGKSTLLRHFYENSEKNVVLLAPTGVAALNIQGVTIHSFFQFPFGVITEEDVPFLAHKKEVFEHIDTLVIDEISMVRADLMHAIDLAMRKNTGNQGMPFGGVQVIMFGDLYQLPPVVSRSEEREYLEKHFGGPYFFHCPSFKTSGLTKIELNKNFRQKDDHVFLDILNAIRKRTIGNEQLQMLNERIDAELESDAPAITLATTNALVRKINDQKLDELDEQEFKFKASVTRSFNAGKAPAPEELRLKVGAQIMMIKNDTEFPRRWVNGSLGVVTRLTKDLISVEINGVEYDLEKTSWEDYEYMFDDESGDIQKNVLGSFRQYPVALAWAVTIHKSQGKTFDNVIIDMGNGAFAHGQTYVALSRCISLEGVSLRKPIKRRDIILDQRIHEFHER